VSCKSRRHAEELISFEIPGQSPVLAGLVFSANAEAVRRKVDKLIFAGFFAAEVELNMRRYDAIKRADATSRQSLPDDSVSSSDIVESFWIYFVGLFLSILTLAIEKLVKLRCSEMVVRFSLIFKSFFGSTKTTLLDQAKRGKRRQMATQTFVVSKF